MVIVSNSENVFLVLKFVIDNHAVQCFGIVSYINHIAIHGTYIGELSEPGNTR